MSDKPEILILDNEDIVLETIEMFYPSDDVVLKTANSLSVGKDILKDQQSVSVIVTIEKLEAKQSFDDLKKELDAISPHLEYILMTDISDFKDVLSRYGSKVSDVLYKPLDMDVLETLIKRAHEKHIRQMQEVQSLSQHDELNIEQEKLSNELNQLKQAHEELIKSNNELIESQKNHDQIIETMKTEQQDVAKTHEEEIENYKKKLEEQKQTIEFQKFFENELDKTASKVININQIEDILEQFEDMIKQMFNLDNVHIISSENPQESLKILNQNQVFQKTQKGIEIPLKCGNLVYSIMIKDQLDTDQYIEQFKHLQKTMEMIIYQKLVLKNQKNLMDKEKNNSKAVYQALNIVQNYMNEQDIQDKISNIKNHFQTSINEVLDLVFKASDSLKEVKSEDEHILKANKELSIIIEEKAQNFDFITQKISHIFDLTANIQNGLKGQKMKKASGDQFLFSKDRKMV